MKPKKPVLLWNTRLGSIGEKAVLQRLSYFSNPTKYDQDLGLDFYCELIQDDSPSTPFYVQVKGTQHLDSSWGSSIPKSTISYWLQQKSPVYLMVFDEPGDICYWMSIEDHRYDLLQKLEITESESIYISLDRSNILDRGKNKNSTFVNKIKEDLASIQLFWGFAQFHGEDYIKTIPSPPRSNAELVRLKENIRSNLYSLIGYYFSKHDLETAKAYCEFLTEFDRSHYNHFAWLGLIYKSIGQTELAEKHLIRAIKMLEGDKNWPLVSKEPIIAMLKRQLSEME
jgi:tetratricopeptide (TPR) repeat protein